MNKTNLLSRIIQTTSIASALSIGCMVSSVEAATLTGTISNLRGTLDWIEGSGSYEGQYIYELSYTWDDETMEGSITITAVSSPNNTYNGGTITISTETEGHSLEIDTSTDPPTITFSTENNTARSDNGNNTRSRGDIIGGLSGTELGYTWTTRPHSITGQRFNFKNTPYSLTTPEPSATVGLLALGIIGTASTLKRKKKDLEKVS